MRLINIDRLRVYNTKIIATGEVAIRHCGCDDFVFDTITFDQAVGVGTNAGGIAGSGTNGVIRNLFGYTADDIVDVGSRRYDPVTQYGYYEAGTAEYLTENVLIENIFPGKKDSADPNGTVGIYAYLGLVTKNVTVRNVQGYSRTEPIRVMDYLEWLYPDGPSGETASIVENLDISNVHVDIGDNSAWHTAVWVNTITVKNLVLDDIVFNFTQGSTAALFEDVVADKITIDGFVANPSVDGYCGLSFVGCTIGELSLRNLLFDISAGVPVSIYNDDSTIIGRVDIDGCRVNYTGATNTNVMMYDRGKISEIFMRDVAMTNVSGVAQHYYLKTTADTTVTTALNLSDVKAQTTANIAPSTGLVAPNGTDCVIDTAETCFVPRAGSVVRGTVDYSLWLGWGSAWYRLMKRVPAATAPTTGGAVGDVRWNSEPAASGYVGWVCTAVDTWKGFGAIQA